MPERRRLCRTGEFKVNRDVLHVLFIFNESATRHFCSRYDTRFDVETCSRNVYRNGCSNGCETQKTRPLMSRKAIAKPAATMASFANPTASGEALEEGQASSEEAGNE